MGVQPIMTFASVVWWNGSNVHICFLQKVQNIALCLITGGFKTSPTVALELESSIPPINLHLDHLWEKFTVQLGKLVVNHPVISCLPDQIRPVKADQTNLPFVVPHKDLRRSKDPALMAQQTAACKTSLPHNTIPS